jgi:hypothetical protein
VIVISLGSEDVTCVLSIRVSHPFDGFFELKLSDASADAYNSVMALDEIEQLKCVFTFDSWRQVAYVLGST